MPNYNTQLQTHNSDLQSLLQILQTKAVGEDVTEEVEIYTNLNEDLEQVINSLPDAGSSEPSGVCPSLTIITRGIYWDSIVYFTGEECNLQTSGGYNDTIVLENVSINTPIFVCGWPEITDDIDTSDAQNVEIVICAMPTVVLKCMSLSPASVTIYETNSLEIGGGGI